MNKWTKIENQKPMALRTSPAVAKRGNTAHLILPAIPNMPTRADIFSDGDMVILDLNAIKTKKTGWFDA